MSNKFAPIGEAHNAILNEVINISGGNTSGMTSLLWAQDGEIVIDKSWVTGATIGGIIGFLASFLIARAYKK